MSARTTGKVPANFPEPFACLDGTRTTNDEAIGMAWWNACSEAARARWLAAAGSAVPAMAWECFKRTSARPAAVIEQYETFQTQADAMPAALGEPS